MKLKLIYFVLIAMIVSCAEKPQGNISDVKNPPQIHPDYSNLILPKNIAPLNFCVEEEADDLFLTIEVDGEEKYSCNAKDGVFRFPQKKWKKLLGENAGKELNYSICAKKGERWTRFATFSNRVSEESIDSYLYYRLLYPGYESWSEISIVQRSMESFKENTVVQNSAVDRNCVNCHAFNAQRADDFLIHMRGSLGGTYFLKDGDLKKFQLKTKEMKNGAVYPRWHPSGKFVAFSSNKIIQQFHASNQNRIEVRDLISSMMVYDIQKNEMFPARLDSSGQYMDTYPEWSPDGKFLYFCRAKLMKDEKDYKNIHYSLYRAAFDAQSRSFSKAELVVDAAANEKSISFPRISPDGKHLVFTFHDYGCFPIWHKEADLKMLNLESGKIVDFRANSDFAESYHGWSQNGKWLIFSSKRGDGLTARPYIAFVDENGETSKAFVLPQESPDFYDSFLKTFNIPELANTDVHFNPAQLRKAVHAGATPANYSTH